MSKRAPGALGYRMLIVIIFAPGVGEDGCPRRSRCYSSRRMRGRRGNGRAWAGIAPAGSPRGPLLANSGQTAPEVEAVHRQSLAEVEPMRTCALHAGIEMQFCAIIRACLRLQPVQQRPAMPA